MNFLELAKKRYSCRKLEPTNISDETLEQILEAGRIAPTAVNAQPFKFFVMKSNKAKEAIHASTPYTFGADTFIVVGSEKGNGYRRKSDDLDFALVDATIVATHIMLQIEDLGLATTWVGAFDPNVLKESFPEMKELDLVAIFPVGKAAEDAKPSIKHDQRKPLEELLTTL